MLIWKRIFIILLTWVSILGWIVTIGQASSPFTLTPQELVRAVRQKFDSIQDYQCQFITTGYKKGQPKAENHNYYFKKPALIRLEVTSGGDKGAVCVFNRKGKVRAHGGGLFGFITITMEPNDKRLADDDGSTFIDSHLGGTIKDLENIFAGAEATLGEIDYQGRKCYLLQLIRGPKKDLLVIDMQLMLPVEWQSYTNGNPNSKTEWRNLQVNVGVKDSLFEM